MGLEELQSYARAGYSRRHTAEILGVPVSTIRSRERRHGWDIRWSQGHRRLLLLVWDGKQYMTLSEMARKHRLPRDVVKARYRSGDRGERLVRPLERLYSKTKSYVLGMSVAELNPVVEYAKERGVQAAYCKFGIPRGAIRAMLNDEWERVS